MKSKRAKKLISVALATCLASVVIGCGSSSSDTEEETQEEATEETTEEAEEETAEETEESSDEEPEEESVEEETTEESEETATVDTSVEDTITVMVPPIFTDYTDYLDEWIVDFNEIYPNITIEVIATTWDDNVEKLTTMAQAGEAPDIANVEANTIGTYVDMGVALSLTEYMSEEELANYDESALAYATLNGEVYGLPLYVSLQALGANKEMLENAGVDVEAVQTEGWSWDEFVEAAANGTTDDVYGFVFANSGVTTADMIDVFGTAAGISNAFTDDLLYAYTSENMYNLLVGIEELIEAGYMPDYAVEAGTRLTMLETGECMITGKAMPLFESNVNTNNAGIEDGTAVEGSIEVEYVWLPCPVMDGAVESVYGTANAFIACRNSDTTDEHIQNVLLFMDYISSGEPAAITANECYLTSVCEDGREAQSTMELDQSEGNAAAVERATELIIAPPSDVTAEMQSNENTLMDEVIVPKMQSLIAGETTADEMFDTICEEAFSLFGEDACETGFIGK